MKKQPRFHALLIASTLFAGIASFSTGCGRSASDSSQEPVLECIATRTSIRSFTDQPVEESHIEKILRAGMAAPTAVNKQPWAFVVVKDKVLLQTLADSLPNAKMTAQAAFAIVACGDMSKALEGQAREFWVQDVSAATENMLLAAHSLGLGAVWTGAYPDMQRAATIRKILQIPSHIIPLNVIPMGYPADSPTPKDKWKPENVHYNTWGGK